MARSDEGLGEPLVYLACPEKWQEKGYILGGFPLNNGWRDSLRTKPMTWRVFLQSPPTSTLKLSNVVVATFASMSRFVPPKTEPPSDPHPRRDASHPPCGPLRAEQGV